MVGPISKTFMAAKEAAEAGKRKAAAEVAEQAAIKQQRYGSAAQGDIDSVASGAHFGNAGGTEYAAKLGSHMKGGWQRDADRKGTSVLGLAGGHAIRGAAWGGVGGGTIESMQGGNFFDGAKQGAVNGAVGWTGYRMAMRGVGATNKLNPFAKGNAAGEGQGLFSAAGNVSRAYGKDADVAKSAQSILSLRQGDAAVQSAMNTRKSTALASTKKQKKQNQGG